MPEGQKYWIAKRLIGGENTAMTKPKPLAAAFAETLEHLRERAGITTADLANATGIDRRYIDKLESGRHLPGLAVLWRLSRALGLPPSQVLRHLERRAGT